jgi:hypothetical protein
MCGAGPEQNKFHNIYQAAGTKFIYLEKRMGSSGMKRFTFIVCISLLLIVLIAAVPVTATSTTISGDSITSVSPAVGHLSKTVTVTISGVNFTSTTGSVRLEKDGETDIDGTVTSWSVSSIVCKFTIKSTKDTGDWDLVVVKGYDSTEIVKADGFAITESITISSISPTSAQADDEDVDFTLTGTNFDEDIIDDVYLYNDNYDNISADDFEVSSTTKIKGTFDLSDADDDKYEVCVEDKYGEAKCDLTFTITTNEVGSIEITSNPSGAAIYVDGIANGTTPNTVDDIIVGSHKITIKKSGYEDWGKIVNVEADDTVDVEAKLYAVSAATTTAPTNNPAPVVTTRPTTARTTAKSTVKVPTSWVDTPTTTAASPVDPVIVIGTIGLAFLALRKP